MGRGATFKEISKDIVANIKIPLPDIKIQKKYAAILDKIDELQSNRQEQIDLLDTLVKSRFVEMFGDPRKNLNAFTCLPMPDLCQIIDGDRGTEYPKQQDFSESGYCLFLNAKNVTNTGFSFETCMFITEEKDKKLRKGKLYRGDIVLTTRGTVGNLAYYTEDIPYHNMRINSGMVILRMKKEKINEIFFMEQFKMLLSHIKNSISSGSAQPQLPISTMNKIVLLVPELELQKQFADFIALIDKSKLALKQSLDELNTLKKAMMQKFFG